MSKQPPPAPTASAVDPCPTIIKIVGRPGTGSLRTTRPPPIRVCYSHYNSITYHGIKYRSKVICTCKNSEFSQVFIKQLFFLLRSSIKLIPLNSSILFLGYSSFYLCTTSTNVLLASAISASSHKFESVINLPTLGSNDVFQHFNLCKSV